MCRNIDKLSIKYYLASICGWASIDFAFRGGKLHTSIETWIFRSLCIQISLTATNPTCLSIAKSAKIMYRLNVSGGVFQWRLGNYFPGDNENLTVIQLAKLFGYQLQCQYNWILKSQNRKLFFVITHMRKIEYCGLTEINFIQSISSDVHSQINNRMRREFYWKSKSKSKSLQSSRCLLHFIQCK